MYQSAPEREVSTIHEVTRQVVILSGLIVLLDSLKTCSIDAEFPTQHDWGLNQLLPQKLRDNNRIVLAEFSPKYVQLNDCQLFLQYKV